jgi:hypothetical protein
VVALIPIAILVRGTGDLSEVILGAYAALWPMLINTAGGALVVCVVGEMLGLQSGVGNQLVLEQSGMQPARMWVYVRVVGVLGLSVNAGLIRAFRVLFPGVAAVAERSSVRPAGHDRRGRRPAQPADRLGGAGDPAPLPGRGPLGRTWSRTSRNRAGSSKCGICAEWSNHTSRLPGASSRSA